MNNRYDAFFMILLYIFLAMILISVVFTFLGCGIACISDKKKRSAVLNQLSGGFTTNGVFSDVQCVFDTASSWQPYHFKLAIQFQGIDGAWHRAFMGITTSVKLQYQPGMSIPLHILPTPMIKADVSAFDATRGADGKINGIINFRKYMDKPIDETGTVMLESDYQELITESQNKIERDSVHAKYWFIATGCSAVLSILAIVSATLLM